MDLPARLDDEDARKLALAPDDDGVRYLHHSDGSWPFVGPDGWPVSLEDFHADALAAITAVTFAPIDIEPILLRDKEIRFPRPRGRAHQLAQPARRSDTRLRSRLQNPAAGLPTQRCLTRH
ncbi:hypothetical protein ACFQZZ_08585 [Nocardia sp. GCM10030253]|uniref:hypothetical protein n=1 Tax=Nocardia sp. GCM10030253 TaxID=3273404 RepID=UPI00363CE7D6